jgi:hypothetical protein
MSDELRKPAGLNGAKFDKLARAQFQKDDDILRTLRKHSPAIAEKIEQLDATFSLLLEKLQKIEDAHEAQARLPSRILASSREPNPDDVLASMARMTPEARATLLNKLKQ